MLAQVQPRLLLVRGGAHAHRQVQPLEDEEGPAEGPAAHGHDADELVPEQAPFAVEEALAEFGGAHGGGGEDARGQRPPDAAHAVHAHHVERVVEARARAPAHGVVADDARGDADGDGLHGLHVAGRGRHPHQPGGDAGGGADDARLASVQPAGDDPGDGSRSRRRHRAHEGVDRLAVGGHGAARAEAEAGEPHHGGAEHDLGDVVGLHGRDAVAAALAEDEHRGQRGEARVHVHRQPAREIEAVQADVQGQALAGEDVEPAVHAEHPVEHGREDDDRPERDEDEEGAEFGAFGEGPGDERGRDDGVGHVEGHEEQVGHAVGEGVALVAHAEAVDADAHAAQAGQFEAADEAEALVFAEGEGVAHEHPEHGHHGHDHERLHDGGGDVLFARHAAVVEGQPRRHEEHQGRGEEHPGGVAGIEFGHAPPPRDGPRAASAAARANGDGARSRWKPPAAGAGLRGPRRRAPPCGCGWRRPRSARTRARRPRRP